MHLHSTWINNYIFYKIMLTNKLWKMKNKIKIKGNSGLKLKQVHNTELYGLLIENWKIYN